MDCDALRDDQWERLKGLVPGSPKAAKGALLCLKER